MKLLRKLALSCVLLVGFGPPLHAQEKIEFSPDESWKHPHLDLAIPAMIGGLQRTHGYLYAEDSLDLGIGFLGETDEVTVYVFRRTNGTVPIWFAQAQDGVERREQYANPVLAGEIASLDVLGEGTASGLKAVYKPGEGSRFTSTGLALFDAGGWYVKVRASSVQRTPAELSEQIDEVLEVLRIGDLSTTTAGVAPIMDCPEPLKYRDKTRDAPNDGAANLLTGLLGTLSVEKSRTDEASSSKEELEAVWCRDARIVPGQVSYRRVNSNNSYLLAIGDNGNAVSVAPDAAAILLKDANDKKGRERFAITLHQAGRNVSFAAQQRFPSPKRVIKILEEGRRSVVVTTWGEDSSITLDPSAF